MPSTTVELIFTSISAKIYISIFTEISILIVGISILYQQSAVELYLYFFTLLPISRIVFKAFSCSVVIALIGRRRMLSRCPTTKSLFLYHSMII